MCAKSQCVVERLSAIMFLVYGDESLDETQSRVCAVGGLVGTEKSWSDLEPKWKSLHCGTPFHATDCDSDKGDYQPKPDEDSDAKQKSNKSLYKASIILLAESGVCGFASAYDLAAEREAFRRPMALWCTMGRFWMFFVKSSNSLPIITWQS